MILRQYSSNYQHNSRCNLKQFKARLYVPQNLDLTIYPEELRNPAAYLMTTIHYRTCNYHANPEGFVSLKYEYLCKVIPRGLWRETVEHLTGWKTGFPAVVVRDLKTAQGEKCMGYKLAEPYSKVRLLMCEDKETNARIARLVQSEEQNHQPVHRWLLSKFDLLEFDEDRALQLIPTMKPDDDKPRWIWDHGDLRWYEPMSVADYHRLLAGQILRLAECDHYLTVDPYGRVHTPLTSLPRELRGCLSVNGDPLVGLDLKNSQPLMLGLVVRQAYRSKMAASRLANLTFRDGVNPYQRFSKPDSLSGDVAFRDVAEYLHRCEEGNFYESFMTPSDDRDAFKVRFFRNVLFGSNKVRSRVKNQFAQRYPSVSCMLHRLKARDYSRAAKTMQQAESTIIIHRVCGRLMRECERAPIFTVHDSILTTRQYMDRVKGTILSEFSKLGVNPRVTIY